MDFSRLTPNERLAAYGAIASIVGGILTIFGAAGAAGGLWLTFLLALAMLFIVFQPQWTPRTRLPGSKGSLMLVVGGIAAVGAVLGLLALLSLLAFFSAFAGFVILPLLGMLLGIGGGLVMGWAGWKEFQAEGGKFQFGTASSDRGTPPPPAAAPPPTERAETTQTQADAAPAAAPPPPPSAAAPRAEEPRADEPMAGDEERRDQV